jgi:ketosteroid isomerase-like protein
MDASESLTLIRGYFDALAKGDLAKLGELFADDIVWHQPGAGAASGIYRGKEQVFALFGKFMEISGGTFQIDKVAAIMQNGDLVSAILHFRATKPGAEIAMDGVDLMRVADGRIKEVWLFSADQAAEDAFWR